MRVSGELMELKQRYPERVFLLLGNRDVNKMRFAAELHDTDLRRDPSTIPLDFWLPRSSMPWGEWLANIPVEHHSALR